MFQGEKEMIYYPCHHMMVCTDMSRMACAICGKSHEDAMRDGDYERIKEEEEKLNKIIKNMKKRKLIK